MTLLDDLTIGVYASGSWHDDILGAHTSVKITRRPMDLSSVSASVAIDQLPSGRDPQLTPGSPYRVLLGSDQVIGCTLTERVPEESNRPIPLTMLEGADAARDLALRKEYRVSPNIGFGPPSLAPLWEAFSDSDIPWLINGSSAAGTGLDSEGEINENMTAIDQIVLARDLNAPAYAWLDREGVGKVSDLAHLSTTPVLILDEDDYSQLVTGFNMDACFNILTVARISGEELGTFTDDASVEQWGERPVTLKTLHLMSEPDPFPAAFAEYFLGLNSDPVFQVLSVQIPLHKINNSAVALLDLYDLVTVQNTARGIDEDLRVTFIEHEITPYTWMLTLGFSVDGIAAIPQVLPEPQS